MTTLYLQHGAGTTGPFCTESVQHQVTAIPNKGDVDRRHGMKHVSTKYLVRYRSMWRRVWQRTDGSHYIIHNYTNIYVLIRD